MAIQSDHEFAPTQIARAVFPTAFRGYDQDAVRRYLSRLAAALEHQQEYAGLGELEARTPAHERVEELETELNELRDEIKDLELELVQQSVAGNSSSGADDDVDADAKTSESVAFDEHRAIELLGQETARVLESARSAAADILKRAETQAASLKAQAKSELAEARRRAESIVSETRAESEEQAAKMADEAQAGADKLRTEAEEHRAAVLDESSKILAEAEEMAEAEQAGSEERAKQIVADAETLRQQVISELVSERRQAQVEMDRMTSARDRLAMSLAVARSELDEVADALVDVSSVSFGGDAAASGDGVRPVDVNQTHADEVDSLINKLAVAEAETPSDGQTEAAAKAKSNGTSGSPKGAAKKKRTKRRRSAGQKAKSESDSESKGAANTGADSSTKSQSDSKAVGGSVSTERSSGSETKIETDDESGPVKTGSALFEDAPPQGESAADETVLEETATEETKADPDKAKAGDGKPAAGKSASGKSEVEEGSDGSDDDTLELEELRGGEAKIGKTSSAKKPAAGVSDRAAKNKKAAKTAKAKTNESSADDKGQDSVDRDSVDRISVEEEGPVVDVSLFEDGDAVSEINDPPPEGQELSLVEGFTTIELNEIDLRDGVSKAERSKKATDEGGGGTGGTSGSDRDLVPVGGSSQQGPEEMITTVSSRTASAQRDRTRGDLLIEEPFTGRLAKEFAARDVALTRSGPNFRRQLRRALNDDQSDVLDRLRAGRGEIRVDELPAFGDQIDRYLTPLRRGLAEIAQAGAKAGGKSDLSQTALDNLVRQLAKYIVDKVRIPTIQVVEQTDDQDRERILEPVRALYRDFRNVGLSELTEDALYEAFAIGLYDSIEPSAPISWVVDPRSDPDPVCDINSQRDDVVKGVVFPSGHARPLSLPGCRCLVMKADY